MPANFDHDFALWLTQHGNERAVAVNVLAFIHPKWGEIYVSDFGDTFAATTETGAPFEAIPLGFAVDLAADNVSTEQRIVIRLDNANGAVADQLRSLDDEDLQTEVQIIYRAYLDTDRSAPAFDPLKLLVTQTSMTRPVVEVEGSADSLPNVGAGLRYTLEEFPPLAFL